jgi:hypothetical protein
MSTESKKVAHPYFEQRFSPVHVKFPQENLQYKLLMMYLVGIATTSMNRSTVMPHLAASIVGHLDKGFTMSEEGWSTLESPKPSN